jgi:hypothetical protein
MLSQRRRSGLRVARVAIPIGVAAVGVLGLMPVTAWAAPARSLAVEPKVSTARNGDLVGVSCTSATMCSAVGQYENSANSFKVLAEAWNGTDWAVKPTPGLTPNHSAMSGVSCINVDACTAVGYYSYSAGGSGGTLAEHWDGTTQWTFDPIPSPTGAQSSSLFAVSCISTDACTAVGYYYNSAGVGVTLAEAWNGKQWTIEHTPNPVGAHDSALNSVSCTYNSTACTAVGEYLDSTDTYHTLAEAWNGTNWTIQHTPAAAGGGLSGVSCIASTVCTAVGGFRNSAGTYETLAEAWNGTAWTIQSSPNPTGATGSGLSGVSCLASTAECAAVGHYLNSAGTYETLAETRKGTAWTIQSTPNAAGTTGRLLSSVSCTSASSATVCTAVGYYYKSAYIETTLAERWNGTAWTIQSTPTPGY